jgi:hypothetical protein
MEPDEFVRLNLDRDSIIVIVIVFGVIMLGCLQLVNLDHQRQATSYDLCLTKGHTPKECKEEL